MSTAVHGDGFDIRRTALSNEDACISESCSSSHVHRRASVFIVDAEVRSIRRQQLSHNQTDIIRTTELHRV